MSIPGGRIIATPSLVLEEDPGQVYASYCRVVATNDAIGDDAIGDMVLELDLPEMTVVVDGMKHECPVTLLDIRGRGLMIAVPYSDDTLYLLACEGKPSQPWHNATKVLALPTATPADWGTDQAAHDQRFGRVLMYAAGAVFNGWFT